MNAETTLENARALLAERPRWLALTGAGMSVDSGVPPFRGPGGLWERMDPETCAHVRTLDLAPERAWELFRVLDAAMHGARPHEGHAALARAEERGKLLGIVTQNIDGLHQEAGSVEVVELHGSGRRYLCHRCGRGAPRPDAGSAAVPRCPCGGVLRPAITLFGEQLPEGALERAVRLLEGADGLLVVGSSCEVFPAASIPDIALNAGLPVLVVGPDPNRLCAEPGAVWLRASARAALPALLAGEGAEP